MWQSHDHGLATAQACCPAACMYCPAMSPLWQPLSTAMPQPPICASSCSTASGGCHTTCLPQVLDCLQRAVSVQCTSIQHPHQRTCGPQATDRVTQAAPVLILFSGGVDSTLIAALAHRALPAHVPIDLSCVCFDGGQSPDRLAALDALQVQPCPLRLCIVRIHDQGNHLHHAICQHCLSTMRPSWWHCS